MAQKPNPLLEEFLDAGISLPALQWETVPPGVNPREVWNGYDEGVDGWVPAGYPIGDPKTGRSYREFQRSRYFDEDLHRILRAMNRRPLWGSPTQKSMQSPPPSYSCSAR